MSTTVDLSDVFAGLNAMKRAGNDLRPVFAALRPAFRAEQQEHFVTATGEGGSWPVRAQSSQKRLLSGGMTKRGAVKKIVQRKIANQLGRLKTAIRYTVTKSYIEAQSMVAWAYVHQEGGTAGKGSVIPQREFLWLSEEMVLHARDALEKYVAGAF